MEEADQLSLYQTQIQTYVSFTSFMTAVVVFFVGLLLSSFSNYDSSVRIPIAFLIISIFGFLYSTLIYTNTAEEVSNGRIESFRRSVFLGDVISEYLGVYLLVLSIPLVVNAVTHDAFLRTITIVSALAGLTIYQLSHVSMIERHFKRKNKPLAFFIVLFGLLLFFAQVSNFHFATFALLFILYLICIILFAVAKKRPA